MGRPNIRGKDAKVYGAKISKSLVDYVKKYNGMGFADFVNWSYKKERIRLVTLRRVCGKDSEK